MLTRTHSGPGQFLMIYGRRRAGKTTLLRHWVEQSGLPFTYWVAEKEPALLQRRRLLAQFLRADPTSPTTPTYDSWSDFWRAAATILADKRHILVIDELPYAAESDGAIQRPARSGARGGARVCRDGCRTRAESGAR